jgi:hypothetical protein
MNSKRSVSSGSLVMFRVTSPTSQVVPGECFFDGGKGINRGAVRIEDKEPFITFIHTRSALVALL